MNMCNDFPNHVFELKKKKKVYGLKQVSKAFYRKFKIYMRREK